MRDYEKHKQIKATLRARLEDEYLPDRCRTTAGQKERLFNLAWDYGHAHGETEVESFYSEMASLIYED